MARFFEQSKQSKLESYTFVGWHHDLSWCDQSFELFQSISYWCQMCNRTPLVEVHGTSSTARWNQGKLASMDFEQRVRLLSFQEMGATQDNQFVNIWFKNLNYSYNNYTILANFLLFTKGKSFSKIISRTTDLYPFT